MKLAFAFLCLLTAAVTAERSVRSAASVHDGELGVRVVRAAVPGAPLGQEDKLPVGKSASAKGSKNKKVKSSAKKDSKKSKKAKGSNGKSAKPKGASKKSPKAGGKNLGSKKKSGNANGKKSQKAGKKSKKAGKKSQNAGKKSKKAGKKSKKAGKKSKKAGKKSKKAGKKSEKKQKPSKTTEKASKTDRQSTNCTVADVVTAIRKFTLYTTNLNQNKRITRFVSQSQSKAGKAATAFETAASTLSDATSNGTSCNGAPINSTTATMLNKLKNCSASAAAICDVKLSAADAAIVSSCNTSLTAFIASFQACVASSSCSCFQALPNLTSCTTQSAILAPVAAQKNRCSGPSTTGSFADCRQQQMMCIGYTTGCKCPGLAINVSVTTKPVSATTKAAGRLSRNRDLFRFKKINF